MLIFFVILFSINFCDVWLMWQGRGSERKDARTVGGVVGGEEEDLV